MEHQLSSRHQLIQTEFRKILTEKKAVDPKTEAIVILSGKQFTTKESGIIKADSSENAENVARITYAVNVIKTIVSDKTIVSQKIKQPFAELTLHDLEEHAPILILSGTTEQLSTMRKIALIQGIAPSKMVEIDCGTAQTANTKTQFETIGRYASENGLRHITLVSSDYHVPRVDRTANKILDPNLQYDVIYTRGVPHDVFQTVKGEVKRIKNYSEKGDISPDARSFVT